MAEIENGAVSLVRSLVASGVDTCFANPGTSEMHFLAALDSVDGMRAVLALDENVATGAADGYGRMTGRPAATLLHLGPGLSNGLSNLHNARRAATPIVNIVGDHATHHAQYDAPLASDIAGLARPVSAWVHSSANAASVGADGARAVQAARAAPGQVATLILPADTAWNPASEVAPSLPVAAPSRVAGETVDRVAKALRSGVKAAMLMRGPSLQPGPLAAAGRVAEATGCRLLADTFAPRSARGAGIVEVERIPYFAEQIVDFFKDVELLILVGAKPPVSFFAYPGKPSWCLPEGCRIEYLAHEHEDGPGALEALADALGGKSAAVPSLAIPDLPGGSLNPYTIGQAIAHLMPEGTIISDDGATSSGGTVMATAHARPHDHLSLTGGAIGQGMPLATGAAIACPDRKVVTLTGDGSAMYTLAALWTQARERLNVVTVVFANRAYLILKVELGRVGAGEGGPKAASMLDIGNPQIDWVKIASGMGVEASRATTIEEFIDQFADAMRRSDGPRLIEAVI